MSDTKTTTVPVDLTDEQADEMDELIAQHGTVATANRLNDVRTFWSMALDIISDQPAATVQEE